MAPMPSAPRPVRRTHALAGAALAVVLAVASLGLGAAPAGAAAPGAPKLIIGIGYKSSIRLYWAPPSSNGGSAVTGYKVQRAFLATDAPDHSWNRPDAAVLVDSDAVNGISYRYRVAAVNAGGTGPWSPWLEAAKQSDLTDYDKFPTTASFVARQYQDFLGRAPTAAETDATVKALVNGSVTPAKLMEALARDPQRVQQRQPVIRLYRAYFRRGADHGGLVYWSTQRRFGTKSLDDVSASFAASSEFRSTYGSLSDAAFVLLVYRNVLGREPDAAGSAFWRQKLAAGTTTRGRMMTQFSESNEFTLRSAGAVLATDVHDAMVGTTISAGDLALWGSHIQGGGTAGGYATRILVQDDYRTSR